MENMNSCCQSILNALPIMIFVVDSDVRIRDLNHAAADAFGLDRANIYKRRGGEVFHCLHSHDVPEGCGRAPACRDCLIRNSVALSLQGQTITRRRTRFEILVGGTGKELELLETAVSRL